MGASIKTTRREIESRGGFAGLLEPVEGDPNFEGYRRIVITVGPEEHVAATTRVVEPGSVSHGTLRLQDLIPTFLIFLTWLDPARHERLTEEIGDAKWGLADDNPWWHSADAAILLDELFDILDEYSPDGYSFGAHEGDGSDFGYWEAA